MEINNIKFEKRCKTYINEYNEMKKRIDVLENEIFELDKYKDAYLILMEYFDDLLYEDKQEVNNRLNKLGL